MTLRWGILLIFNNNNNKKDLTIDLRDAVGDRLHLSNSFVKDGVSYHQICRQKENRAG